ncbi:MAG TPA: hypothetical protein VMT68_04580 [Caulobacteraceae bacterium]|nr:hypothetical protein [Caulobacteraceae bacterium]
MRGWATLLLAAALTLSASAAFAAGERLVMTPYPGAPWKRITDKSGPQGWIHEQVPAAHAVDDYSEMLTDQAFVANRGADPSAFLKTIYAHVGGACAGVGVSGPTPQLEGGLRVAYGQVRCGTERGQAFGVHLFYKVIAGDDALYSISWELRVPPSSNGDLLSFPKGQEARAAALLKTEAEADRYLADQVYLCGGRSTDERCR